jgi:hypothetical protein
LAPVLSAIRSTRSFLVVVAISCPRLICSNDCANRMEGSVTGSAAAGKLAMAVP